MIDQFEDLMSIVHEPTGNVFIDKIKNKNTKKKITQHFRKIFNI
jgi:hypothetical protein